MTRYERKGPYVIKTKTTTKSPSLRCYYEDEEKRRTYPAWGR